MARVIIKEILKEKGISIKELAGRMNITPSAVSQLLANENPSLYQLNRIAETIGVNPMDLIAEDFSYINGFVETGNQIYSIKSREQFINIIDKVDGIVHIPICNRGSMLKDTIEDFYNRSTSNMRKDAITYRYGINEVFTLMFDAEVQRFYLTLCKCDGITEFKIFDISQQSSTLNTDLKKNSIVDNMMDFIEAIYE